MAPVLIADAGQYLLGMLLFVTSLFLILLILVQRGRGGGLTGALGGVGGQSAFGTKAGDLFTKITVGAACFWILLCMLTIITLNGQSGFQESGRPQTGPAREAGELGLPPGGEPVGKAAGSDSGDAVGEGTAAPAEPAADTEAAAPATDTESP